jgi:hypothetical protein
MSGTVSMLRTHALRTSTSLVHPLRYEWKGTYGLVMIVAQRLAHELRCPVVLAVFGLDTGDYEGHDVCCVCEAAC